MSKKYIKKSNKLKKAILLLLILIFLLGIGYLSYYFYNSYRNKNNEDILKDIVINEKNITETKTERMLKLEELQKDNSDIVAWIEIKGTNINYPVLQAEDNVFYMRKNYKKEYSYNGSIFLDKDYDWNLPSSNLLIYGHNNKNGTMFEQLLKYEEESYYREHPTIRFTTNAEDVEYEIMAVFYSRVYYKSEKNVFRYYYFVNAKNEEEYNEFVTNAKKASIYDTGVTAKYGEQLLTLSTCSYYTDDGRFAVVAKKVN